MRGATISFVGLSDQNVISTHTPHAGRDLSTIFSPSSCAFQLTRPMRGATVQTGSDLIAALISTHTPHAGRDQKQPLHFLLLQHFNSHAPCGARHVPRIPSARLVEFQLTRPMRGATAARCRAVDLPNFNSHAPCGARRRGARSNAFQGHFNSHAPCGARRYRGQLVMYTPQISTHTPHAGRDPE